MSARWRCACWAFVFAAALFAALSWAGAPAKECASWSGLGGVAVAVLTWRMSRR